MTEQKRHLPSAPSESEHNAAIAVDLQQSLREFTIRLSKVTPKLTRGAPFSQPASAAFFPSTGVFITSPGSPPGAFLLEVFLAPTSINPGSRAHRLCEDFWFYLTWHDPQINHFVRVNNIVPLTAKCFQIEGPPACFNEQIRIFVINLVMACM